MSKLRVLPTRVIDHIVDRALVERESYSTLVMFTISKDGEMEFSTSENDHLRLIGLLDIMQQYCRDMLMHDCPHCSGLIEDKEEETDPNAP